ncbi:MAG: hypothetical protein M3Q65_05175 [Chloroflexota bacterium]|nr:hypothetical protein [Chloroflexota bacterium]
MARRLVGGAMLVALLAGLWLPLGSRIAPHGGPRAMLLGVVVIGLLGGFVMRSWRAVGLVPVAVVVGFGVWGAYRRSRFPYADPPFDAWLALIAIVAGGPAGLAALVGVLLARRRG